MRGSRGAPRETVRLQLTRFEARNGVAPQHGEKWLDHFIFRRQVHPYLKELEPVALSALEKRHHLAVANPLSRCHPLAVT